MTHQLVDDLALLPCPFCGGSAVIEMDDSLGYWIQCDSCVVTGPTYRDEHIAVERWNRRTEASKPVIADELAKALKNCLRVIDHNGALDADPQRTAMDGHAAIARYEASKQSEKPDTAQDVVTVPREPTKAMFDAARKYYCELHPNCGLWPCGEAMGIYKAMLAAAPAHPQAEVTGWQKACEDAKYKHLQYYTDTYQNGWRECIEWIERRARELAAAQARVEGKA